MKKIIILIATFITLVASAQAQFERDSLYPFPFTQTFNKEGGEEGQDTFWVYTNAQNHAVEVLIDYNYILKDEIWALMGQDSSLQEINDRQTLVVESQQGTIETLSNLSFATLDRSQDLYERSVVSVENVAGVAKKMQEERDQNAGELSRAKKRSVWKGWIIAAETVAIAFIIWICT